jgi:hypothetical protein
VSAGDQQRIWAELGDRHLLAAQIRQNPNTSVVLLSGFEGLGFRNVHLTIPRPTGNPHVTFESRDGSKIAIYRDGLRITSTTPSDAVAVAASLETLPDFFSTALQPIDFDADHCVQLWCTGLPPVVAEGLTSAPSGDDAVLPQPAWLASSPDAPLNISVHSCPDHSDCEVPGTVGFEDYRVIETKLSQTRRLVVVVGWPSR